MNKARRKQIEEIRARLDALKTQAEEIASDLESIKDEEQDAFDNMPESLQDGERGQKVQEAIDHLENAHSEISCGLTDIIDECLSYLESAAE